jgi:hypothetical protein
MANNKQERLDEFLFQFEWDAGIGYLKHKTCQELIELMEFESLETLVKIAKIHLDCCEGKKKS